MAAVGSSVFGYRPTYSTSSIQSLKGFTPSPAPAAAGGVLIWDAATGTWGPGSATAGGLPPVGSATGTSRNGSLAVRSSGNLADSYLIPSAAVYDPVALKYRQRLQNVDEPIAADDLATRNYVLQSVAGLNWKESVVAVTTANVTLSGATAPANVDGVTLANGDRVLVRAQSTATQNGVYVANTSGVWTRATDFAAGLHVANFAVNVEKGTLYAGAMFACVSDPPADVAGTSALLFTQVETVVQAGNALSKTLAGLLSLQIDTSTPASLALSANALKCTLVPMGTIVRSCVAAMTGFLRCDGAAYSRTTYAALFALLNVSKGAVTVSIATPGVVTFASAHGLTARQSVFFSTTGALPTGLAADTTYFVDVLSPTTLRLATSLANLDASVFVGTSGTQSGTHTLFASVGGVAAAATFNVPNLGGLAIAHASSSYGPGAQTGASTVVIPDNPAHTHSITPGSHTHSYLNRDRTYVSNIASDKILNTIWAPIDFMGNLTPSVNSIVRTTGAGGAASGTTDPVGSSTPFSRVQKTAYVYSFIKYE